jgi:DNA invertase Pin-like site-specific DNA recombinase
MVTEFSGKISKDHLDRDAFLYVRQSTIRQVFENTESTKRQYALRERARALGWPRERIHVIDCDQGQSGSSVADREGFQALTAEVGMGRAGIILSLEVSRLARNCSDWHRLLEICALTGTLILDEEGIYDPSDFNDRLLLGLKGTMSEAELFFLRSRLRGGILNKARRGELHFRLPIGFVYGEDGTVRLDPDKQVQDTIRLFFETFRRTRSVLAVVRHINRNRIPFPRRAQAGPGKGEVYWGTLCYGRALHLLHNPRYTGAYCYGRTRRRRGGRPEQRERLAREDWLVFLPEAHEGYISWNEYEENQRLIATNGQRLGKERESGPAREGSALLQGLVMCGRCGRRMKVRYHQRRGEEVPTYVCQYEVEHRGGEICQSIAGYGVDAAIGELLVELVTPVALEAAVAVRAELCARREEAASLRRQAVERARYEAELARRRYMRVDPDNRLVADEIEAEWNAKLRLFRSAQEECELREKEESAALDSEATQRVMALATDFPRLWADPATAQIERKRMVRLLIEDDALTKNKNIAVQVRFTGGATREFEVPAPQRLPDQRRTPPAVVQEVDKLLEKHTDLEIVELLNKKGLRTGMGKEFTLSAVRRVRMTYGLKTQLQRLHARGLLTPREMAEVLGIDISTVHRWRSRGKLIGYRTNDRSDFLYEPPDRHLLE